MRVERAQIRVLKALLNHALKRLGLRTHPSARCPQDQQVVLLNAAQEAPARQLRPSLLGLRDEMIEELDQLIEDISGVNSKLILLIGPPRSGKSNLLRDLADSRKMRVLSVGAALGRRLLTEPSTQRHLQAADLLKGVADHFVSRGLLLMDNIELLFDRTLQLSPLDLLKRHAHAHRVVAAWPGELWDGRLTYATTGHPEYQDYGIDGLVPFKIY